MAASYSAPAQVYTESELTAMTKTQLLEIAAALGGLGVTSSNLKADIIAAIMEAQNDI